MYCLVYTLDEGGRRIQLRWPNSTYISYTYDSAGQMLAMNEGPIGSTAMLWSYSYSDFGRRVRRTSRYGQYLEGQADGLGRLTGLTTELAGTVHDNLTSFAYNPASQIAARTQSNDAFAWGGHAEFDRPYAANGLNQYTSAGPATFAYDANGNLVSDGASAYVYDVENRLVSASGSTNAQLRYDPLGRLYETSGGAAGVTRFLYDGDELVVEYDAAGTQLRRYAHGAGIDDPVIWWEGPNASDPRWLMADHQGSIVAGHNAFGGTALNSYDPYGIPGAGNQGRFGYTGQAWIPELGMYHYKARLYSPTLGRFMQTDPIGYDDQINLYAYVGNDPVNATDPTGQEILLMGTSEERRQLREDIMAVATSDPRLTRRYNSLVRSRNTHLVYLGPAGSRSRIREIIPVNAENGRGTSTRVFVEAGASPLADGTARNTRTTLAHELFSHSYDADRGTKDTDIDPATGEADYEIVATQVENIYRRASGMEERTHYGRRRVPSPNSQRRGARESSRPGSQRACDTSRAGSCGGTLEVWN